MRLRGSARASRPRAEAKKKGPKTMNDESKFSVDEILEAERKAKANGAPEETGEFSFLHGARALPTRRKKSPERKRRTKKRRKRKKVFGRAAVKRSRKRFLTKPKTCTTASS